MEQSRSLLASALEPSTLSAYNKAWDRFVTFAKKHNLPQILPIPVPHLLMFFTQLVSEGLCHSSLPPIASALSYFHKMKEVKDTPKAFAVQQLFQAVRRTRSSNDVRQPMTVSILSALIRKLMSWVLPKYEFHLIKAMFTLAFHFGLRISEITTSPHNLQFEDIKVENSQLSITFKKFKHYQGLPLIHTIKASFSTICPVSAIITFCNLRGKQPGPLFILKGKPISSQFFNSNLKALLEQCNIKGKITSHSFRIGAATLWASLKYSETQIRNLGRWKSNAFHKYLRGPIVHPT